MNQGISRDRDGSECACRYGLRLASLGSSIEFNGMKSQWRIIGRKRVHLSDFLEAIYLKFHRSIASPVTLSSARFMLNFDAVMLNFDTVRP